MKRIGNAIVWLIVLAAAWGSMPARSASTVTDRIDGVSASLAYKAPVRVATTANITLSGLQTIDGVALATGERVLVKDQTTATANGIYQANTSSWTRALDFDGNRDVAKGTHILVTDGTANANTYWRVTNANPITIGTTSFAFAQATVTDGATVAFIASGTGAVSLPIQSVARSQGVTPQQFGAVGDCVTDDTTALQNWITALGTGTYETTVAGTHIGFIPAGCYKHTATLTIPGAMHLYGVQSATVFKPTAAVTGRAIVVNGVLEGVVVDGSATSGAIGLGLGTETLTDLAVARDVRVVHFKGANARGVKVDQCVNCSLYNVYVEDNEYGVQIGGTAGYPTASTFVNVHAKQNVKRGINIQTGFGLNFFGGITESNGEEGLYINQGANTIEQLLFDGMWFENNWQTLASGVARHAAYDVGMAAASGVSLRNCYFSSWADSPRAAHLETATNYLIDNCTIRSEAGQILVDTNSRGHITNWPVRNGDPLTTVTDNSTYGNTQLIYEKHGTQDLDLTFVTPGNLAVTYTGSTTARWAINGTRVTITFSIQTATFTHTTASGNLRLTPLPFTAKTATNNSSVGACAWQGITKANYTDVNARVTSGATYIDFVAGGSAQPLSNIAAADMPSAGTVILNCTVEYER